MLVLLAASWTTAAAAPVLVRVRAPASALSAPVVLESGGSSWSLRDDGQAPDPFRSDGVWTGVASAQPGAEATLRLTEGGGRAWSGGLTWPSGDVPELDLVLSADGGLSAGSAAGSAPLATAATLPAGAATTPRAASGSWAWAVAAAGWGLALAGLLRRLRRAPRPLAPATSPLGAHRYRVEQGTAADALRLLAAEHRVLVVGALAEAPPAGVAFAPDSADPGDVAAALRALDGRGRPLAVLVVWTPEIDLAGVLDAAPRLPVVVAGGAAVPGARGLAVGRG